MTRLVTLYSLLLAISTVPGGFAGPACAHKNFQSADCVQKCKSKWGWKGSMMGTDRWGSVVNKLGESNQNWDSVVYTACGSAKSALPDATTSVAISSLPTLSEVAPIGAASDPAQAAPTTSTLVSSSSVSTGSAHSFVALPSSVVSSIKSTSPHTTSTSPHTTSTPSTSPHAPTTTSISSHTPTTTSTPDPKPTTSRFVTSVRPSPQPTTSQKTTTITKAASPTPTQAPAANTDSSSSSGTSSGDIQAYLSAHNDIRAQHGATPLTWSDQLAGKAQQWANGCKFQHSGGTLGALGENLAAGTGSSYGISQAIKSWTDEVGDYDPNNPQPSHFTQVVWKGSREVGCAVQECSGIFPSEYGQAKYYVCEYSPAGNVIGAFAQNVQV